MSNEKVFEIKSMEYKDFNEFIADSVKDIRKYMMDKISDVENIKNDQIKLLCYFSLIESMAQDEAKYPYNGQQKAFTNFVIRYQDIYDFLEFIDPVTLYYHYQDELEMEVNLYDFIDDGGIYDIRDLNIRKLMEKTKIVLLQTKQVAEVNKMIEKHRYVDLLYRFRCLVSHEFSEEHASKSKIQDIPYYINSSRFYKIGESDIKDDVWQLRIPIIFIKKLCINCVNNYLDNCLKNKKLPMSNDTFARKSKLSWYQGNYKSGESRD